MGLLDETVIPETVQQATNRLRKHLAAAVHLPQGQLERVRAIVAQYGRPAIAAELGADAPTLLTVYNNLKAAIEVATGKTVEDLP